MRHAFCNPSASRIHADVANFSLARRKRRHTLQNFPSGRGQLTSSVHAIGKTPFTALVGRAGASEKVRPSMHHRKLEGREGYVVVFVGVRSHGTKRRRRGPGRRAELQRAIIILRSLCGSRHRSASGYSDVLKRSASRIAIKSGHVHRYMMHLQEGG